MTLNINLDKKIQALILFFTAIIFVIIFRLIYLQIYLFPKLAILSSKNFIRFSRIDSLRGNIIDCNDELLATNKPIANIYWEGKANKNKEEIIQILKKVESILDKELISDQLLVSIMHTEKYQKSTYLAKEITFDQLSKLSEMYLDCISIETKFKRHYPHKFLASHILGYLGQIDYETIGKMGLEALFEEQLKGEDGTEVLKVNSIGKSLENKELKSAIAGKTIKTTLDINIQKILEQSFPPEYAGAAIIFDPSSGAIRAVCSRPTFDPSIFLKTLNYTDWQELQEKQPFLNRVFNANYPPASLFKLVTASAALETNLCDEEQEWECKGHIKFGQRDYHCNKREGHGKVKLKDALIYSCNIPFFHIAKKIKIDTLAKYANEFGLGRKTGILFSEKNGLIPTEQWKREIKGQRWWTGENLSAAIGQSFILVTPLQVVRMIGTICKGKLAKPRILEKEPIQLEPVQLSQKTLNLLRESMRGVTLEGTAKKLNKIEDLVLFSKTGTAQTSSLGKQKLGQEFLEHAWFAGYFQYKNHDPLTITFLIENAGATRIVVNTVKKFFGLYKQLLDRQ